MCVRYINLVHISDILWYVFFSCISAYFFTKRATHTESPICHRRFPTLTFSSYLHLPPAAGNKWVTVGYVSWNIGCLIGILKLVYYNPYIIPIYKWVGFHPLYPNQVFVAQMDLCVNSVMSRAWHTRTWRWLNITKLEIFTPIKRKSCAKEANIQCKAYQRISKQLEMHFLLENIHWLSSQQDVQVLILHVFFLN